MTPCANEKMPRTRSPRLGNWRSRRPLKAHLSGKADDGIVAEFVLGDEQGKPPAHPRDRGFPPTQPRCPVGGGAWSNASAKEFAKSAKAFEHKLIRFKFCEKKTKAACRAFIALLDVLGGPALGTAKCSGERCREVGDEKGHAP